VKNQFKKPKKKTSENQDREPVMGAGKKQNTKKKGKNTKGCCFAWVGGGSENKGNQG